MATPNQWAIREVALATFYDIATGKAILHLQNLKTSGIENSAETVYARGGRGNAKVVGFSANREAKVSLEDCVFTNQAIAMMTGNGIVTGASNIYKREAVTVTVAGEVNIANTPVLISAGNNFVGVFKMNADGSHGNEFTQAGTASAGTSFSYATKKLTFNTADAPVGSTFVVYYKTATASDAKKITISADKFAGSFKLVLDCLVRDASTKQDYYAQVEVFACKMEDNWSMTMAAEGDPSTFTMPIEVLKPATGVDMWIMTIYDGATLT